MKHVQTKSEIGALLRSAGLRPRKRLGQHFLIDGNLMRRLVESARMHPGDLILEVGSGTGGLTELLVDCGGDVVCVEVDPSMIAILEGRFQDHDHVTIIEADVLARKHELTGELVRRIQEYEPQEGGQAKLVANLPYQIATPLVMNLMVDFPQVKCFCFTVQAEVGDRLVASPNCKSYGPLSIVSQALCKVEVVARIPPSAFWPRPAVDSVMIHMEQRRSPFNEPEDARRFASLVRGVFTHRRKTIRSAIDYVIDAEHLERLKERYDTKRRPQSFDVAEWLDIFSLGQS